MSARKSFDIGRKPPAPKPQKATSKPHARVRRRRPLRARRRAREARTGTLFIVGAVLIAAGILYLLWRPEVRITDVRASGIPDGADAKRIVASEIAGTYSGILPRDSVFFFPERAVRAALLDAYPFLSAVSVSRASFSALDLNGTERAAAFYWCGTDAGAFDTADASCFDADSDGLVFAAAENIATSSPLLRVYAPLEGASSASPLRAHVIGSANIPNLLRFVKAVKTLGVPVLSVSIQNDEAALFVTPKTVIKYVLGREEAAAKSAQAAFPTLDLLDGSLEYVDLRFEGKVYVKPRK